MFCVMSQISERIDFGCEESGLHRGAGTTVPCKRWKERREDDETASEWKWQQLLERWQKPEGSGIRASDSS